MVKRGYYFNLFFYLFNNPFIENSVRFNNNNKSEIYYSISEGDVVKLSIFIWRFKNIADILFNNPILFSV